MVSNMNVLIVDDDDVDREHIRRTLCSNEPDCVIMEAPTVEEGLSCYRQQSPDVVLLDYKMPQRDGIEMLLELRSERKENSHSYRYDEYV